MNNLLPILLLAACAADSPRADLAPRDLVIQNCGVASLEPGYAPQHVDDDVAVWASAEYHTHAAWDVEMIGWAKCVEITALELVEGPK